MHALALRPPLRALFSVRTTQAEQATRALPCERAAPLQAMPSGSRRSRTTRQWKTQHGGLRPQPLLLKNPVRKMVPAQDLEPLPPP